MRTNRTIADKPHQLIVLRVTSRDAKGRPKTCDVGFDDTVFDIENRDEFITAWIPVLEKTS